MGRLRGLDTNVLVRFVTRDDPEQAEKAHALVEATEAAGDRFAISLVVLCETVWTLSGRGYGHSRHDIAAFVQRLLETPVFHLESRDVVRTALSDFVDGRAGFADYLIGYQHRALGCDDTATFDRRLAESPLFAEL